MKLLALVVLFKIAPEASESLISLSAQRGSLDTHVLVWDNSPKHCSKESNVWLKENFTSCEYHHCSDNWPLSRLYNQVIRAWIKEQPERFSHLLLLDQDSTLDPLFVKDAARAISSAPVVGLFLPLVKASGIIVSPAHLFYFKGFRWKAPKLGLIPLAFTTAINSGMIIASSYLRNKFPGYPEELSFYGTDRWFCEQYGKDETYAYVFDSTVHHNLALFNKESVEIKLWRHREDIRALRLTNSSGTVRRSACYVFSVLSCARMAWRFRDRRFFSC